MKRKNDSSDFRNIVKGKKIPILILDSKWHALFQYIGKPQEIVEKEEKVNKLLKLQGKFVNDIKSMRHMKKQLLNAIVANMEPSSNNQLREKKLSKNKELIEDINVKLAAHEEELAELPYEIAKANRELMAEGITYCYHIFSQNRDEIDSLSMQIEELKSRLDELTARKQEMEEQNSQMYSYLHNIVGHEVMEYFDEEL